MPRNITLLRAFISGPSDVEPDKKIIREVIDNINSTWLHLTELRIEPFSSSDIAPSVGSDPQDAINSQISNDYDLFIAVLWTRLGTPTPRAPSGTVEEILNAHSILTKDNKSPNILIYFKNAEVPADADFSQVNKVKEFKRELGKQGFFYRQYSSLKEFQELLNANLADKIKDWIKTHPPQNPKPNPLIWKWVQGEYRRQDIAGYSLPVANYYIVHKSEKEYIYDPYTIIDLSAETSPEALSGRSFTVGLLDGIMNEWKIQNGSESIDKLTLIVIGPNDMELLHSFIDSVRRRLSIPLAFPLPKMIFGNIQNEEFIELYRS